MAEEDLIFGKNRHFFGGIEPSNMQAFNVTRDTSANKVAITATLPADTVIDGQTLCSVAGAVIRRSTTNYPTDEFSGELVADIKSSQTFYDESADITGTYYYAAFPYTTQGVYNRNPINRRVINEPQPMQAFTALSIYTPATQTAVIRLTATLPDGVAGAVIRRSTTGFPANENDGEELTTITASGTYDDDTVILNTTYYYAAFPYTSTGAYNRNPSNRLSVTPSPVIENMDPMVQFSASSEFNVEQNKAVVKIVAEMPTNAVGVVIRRSTTDYPATESDGDEIATINANETVTDDDVTVGTTYYYAAFPFTVSGYSRRTENRTTCTPTVVDDTLAAMPLFSASSMYNTSTQQASVTLTAQFPENAIGVIIRRSTSAFPATESDGDLVTTMTSAGTFTDTNVVLDTTYYYSAFPYSTKGCSRKTENRTSCKPVALDESLAAMPTFTAKSAYNASAQQATVKLTVALPTNATGVIIRKSTSGYPATETEGSAVTTMTAGGDYTDTNVVIGTTYYYAAFPYSDNGISRKTENRATCVPSKYEYLYGFDLNKADTNPATRVSYPDDVDNASYTAAKMNFGGAFSYGGWPSEGKFMPKPCMLKFDGVVDHYLNPNDYTKKTDGSGSKVADASFGGNAMMEWPKIYVKRWEENGVYHFRCSDVKMDDDWECWSNYDKNNREIPHFYTPIYFGSKDGSGRMRSISGQTNWVSTGGAQPEIDAAKACGADIWYTECLADWLLVGDLLVMMGKSTDGQGTYGNGVCGASAAIGQGTMNNKGLFWGASDKTSGVKIFGMENAWGNLWRRLAGWILDAGVQKVKITRGTKDGTTATDFNTNASGYKTVAGANLTALSGAYISAMKTEPFGRLPIAATGSSSTNECDAIYTNVSGQKYAVVGGNYNNDLLVGPFCVALNSDASISNTIVGAALSCKPLAA